MKIRLVERLVVAVVALAVTAMVPLAAMAGPADQSATEDILYMLDGRDLHGHILGETDDHIVFELVNETLGLRSKITLSRAEISRIERAVPLEDAKTAAVSSRDRLEKDTQTGRRFGRSRSESDDPNVPVIYVIPMKGQMGTDIHKSIYEEIVKDIHRVEPELIIFELDSKDFPDLMIPQVEDPRDSRGFLDFDEWRDMVKMFKDDLSHIRQVVWVKDSVGFSTILALSWEEMYMAPEARLAGLRSIIDTSGADKWSDRDVRAKMKAAWGGFVKAFLELGGYSPVLADAMLWPEEVLSASYKGREVVWSATTAGEFIVDSDDERTVGFKAKIAEDLLISDGTVDTLDDLAFLLGYREYREVGASGQKMVDNYVERWQRLYDQTQDWYNDYFQHQGWASGDETLKWLGAGKRDLENIINAMSRYRAVEVRWQRDHGVSKLQLEIEVEKMKEQIRALKQGGRRGGYGGGGGGFGGGGG